MPAGIIGLSTSTTPDAASMLTPSAACNIMNTDPAAQACGRHATG